MKPVATPWYKLYKPLLFGFGIPFTLIGIITLYINGNLAFIYNGILWLIIGCGLKFKGDYNKCKLKSLKREGLSYECSVMHIIPAHWVTEFVKQVVAFSIKNIFRYFRFAIDMEPLPIWF